jgi:Spy/CpxP family protein refolding chaperone
MFRSTIALAALSLVFAAAPAALSAQTAAPTDSTAPATASRHHHKHVLLRGIKLTDTQRTQLKAIKAKYRPQLRAAHQANDKDTMHQLRGQMIGETRGVLTPDQQQKFDANLAALKQHHKAAPTATPAPAPGSAS